MQTCTLLDTLPLRFSLSYPLRCVGGRVLTTVRATGATPDTRPVDCNPFDGFDHGGGLLFVTLGVKERIHRKS
jgi:hypothetical protein